MINEINELEFIYTIVLNNLEPCKYSNLLLEAQEAMLREVEILMCCPQLEKDKKRKISDAMRCLNNTLERE